MMTSKGANNSLSPGSLSGSHLPSSRASSLLLSLQCGILPPRGWYGDSSSSGNVFCQPLSSMEGCPPPWSKRNDYVLQIEVPHLCQGWSGKPNGSNLISDPSRISLINFTGNKADILEYLFVDLNREKWMV